MTIPTYGVVNVKTISVIKGIDRAPKGIATDYDHSMLNCDRYS